MIENRDMPARLNRALQRRIADRLRSSLARDERSGLPLVGALSDDDASELREVGGGRLAAIVLRVGWVVDATHDVLVIRETHSLVMREAARLIQEQVRRTDLLGSLSEDALLIVAPGLDRVSAVSLAERLRDRFAGRPVAVVGDAWAQLRLSVGVAFRGADSPPGWSIHLLTQEAERNAADPPPVPSLA